jgi:hypothetical protein
MWQVEGCNSWGIIGEFDTREEALEFIKENKESDIKEDGVELPYYLSKDGELEKI